MFIYNLVILLYGFVIKLASFKKLKAKQWVNGRKDWQKNYTDKIAKLNSDKRIWIHCASYGEFEQGRPLIDEIKKQYPSYKIILTFFSPSGYEAFKNWSGADIIGYLPLDTKSNATDFLNIVKPKAAIFIKYEFWVNFLLQLKQEQIPAYLVSAVFKPHHPFFKWYGGLFIRSLTTFNQLFIQDENSGKLLESIGIKNYSVTGDTRFDRVIEIKNNHTALPYIELFCNGNKIIVAGSTWPQDEELIVEIFKKLAQPNVKLILVPHEVDKASIDNVVSMLVKNELSYLLYSEQKNDLSKQVLIIDTIGLLSKIYFYASVAYVGGGFNDGIHNCLEPAVYLKPVIFYGNSFTKFNEAVELVNIGAAKNVMNKGEALSAFNLYLSNSDSQLNEKLSAYFNERSGTSKKVLESLKLS